ncbi:Hypothetical protein NTJ_04562 [Nesidiocoris tenuis]|uniref:Uncharacterized protein n=1 Tax=Nesidiocoris tenuis TaxID=355587 RepID=A0ABN7AKM1_9HEMI|nr:Hypothetical protein NTJ_04562 [Nesidiocoris tenuis]
MTSQIARILLLAALAFAVPAEGREKRAYGSGSASPGSYASSSSSGGSFGGGFPSFGSDPYQIHQQILNQIQRLQEENLRLSSQFAGASPQNGIASAFASGNIGPQGGYGSAGVSPPDPGSLFVRFGDTAPGSVPIGSIAGNIPPPSGSVYGISTSSQSGSTTINGQTKSYKTSEVTVNDNGKITTYKAHNP